MKGIITIMVFVSIFHANCQTLDEIVGRYIAVDSISSSYEKEGKWYKDIDTTQLTLNKDMTFIYKWSPKFGRYSKSHIFTTGTWRVQNGEILLNSKYQQDEYRFFENHKPEYGDSLVKIYVQTYDSLIGYFQFQNVGVVKDNKRFSKMIFKDKDYAYNACSATFQLKNVDKIVFYGNFGQMPAIVPKEGKSNHFLLQYNVSSNWDYQYFKDFRVGVGENKVILGADDDTKVELIEY